jgi:hypothetical protein
MLVFYCLIVQTPLSMFNSTPIKKRTPEITPHHVLILRKILNLLPRSLLFFAHVYVGFVSRILDFRLATSGDPERVLEIVDIAEPSHYCSSPIAPLTFHHYNQRHIRPTSFLRLNNNSTATKHFRSKHPRTPAPCLPGIAVSTNTCQISIAPTSILSGILPLSGLLKTPLCCIPENGGWRHRLCHRTRLDYSLGYAGCRLLRLRWICDYAGDPGE